MAMAAVQLDRNSNAKALARDCSKQGLVACHRLPQAMKSATDDIILMYAKARGRLTFTYDRTMVEEYWSAITNGFPGVIILSQDDDGPYKKQMTYSEAVKILKVLKDEFPQWHSISWENSVVEIKPSHIYVNHVEADGVLRTPGGFLERSVAAWQAALQGLLAANASRTYS